MAEFSGRVVNAQYMNAEYSIIKVSYEGDDGQLYVYHLDVDAGHQDYKDLLAEGWDVEKLVDATAESKRTQAAAWNSEVNAAAQVLAREMLGMNVIQQEKERLLAEVENKEKQLIDLDKNVKVASKTVDNDLYDYIIDNNIDKEQLFKVKLWALELDVVKDSAKDIKSSIRKALRITQIVGIVDSLIK